jgi:hypothetical protein
MQNQPVFLVREAVGEPFTGRTDVGILFSHVAEVLLAEATFGFRPRGHRFGQSDRDACLLAGQNLGAVEIAAVSDDIEVVRLQRSFVCLATLASCDRSLPTLITSCVTIR